MVQFGDNRLPARFWSKVETQPNGCWLWTVARTGYKRQYAAFNAEGTVKEGHRYAYVTLIGKPPEGLVLDHTCRTPHCVNPNHLEPVTQRENVLCGAGFAARHARKTHCPNGHEYTSENTRVYRGMRNCRRCASDSVNRRREAGYFREYEKRRVRDRRKKGI